MANPATQANPATGDAATFRPQQKQQQGGVQQEQAGYWGNTSQQDILHFLQDHRSHSARVLETNQRKQALHRHEWTSLLA